MGKPAGKDAVKAARTAVHRERRINNDARDKAGHAAKAARVFALRKLGAVRRLERRIDGGNGRLAETLVKATAALKSAERQS